MLCFTSNFYLCGAAKESKAPTHAAYSTMFTFLLFFHLHQNMHATILGTFLRCNNV